MFTVVRFAVFTVVRFALFTVVRFAVFTVVRFAVFTVVRFEVFTVVRFEVFTVVRFQARARASSVECCVVKLVPSFQRILPPRQYTSVVRGWLRAQYQGTYSQIAQKIIKIT